MTRTYALKRLLEHGPMRRAALIECTRWEPRQLDSTLTEVLQQNLVKRCVIRDQDGRGMGYRAVMP